MILIIIMQFFTGKNILVPRIKLKKTRKGLTFDG